MTHIDKNTSFATALQVYTVTVAFIQEAHRGQKYGNMPYFFHPVEVSDEAVKIAMLNEVDADGCQAVMLAALLHDVIEDTPYAAADLRERYSNTVVDAVVLLTHNELDYLENIRRIINSENLVAMIVKLADNRVNRRGDKSKFSEEKAARLNTRYDASIKMLTAALAERGRYA